MKIGVSSYSYARLVQNGQLQQIDVIAQAKKMGFDAIEFSGFIVSAGSSADDVAQSLRDEAYRVGLPIVNYAIGADLLKGNGGDLDAEVERLKGEVRIAKLLGCTRMRHDASSGFAADPKGPQSFDAALPRLADGCRRVTQFAADLGIMTMVENHGYFCQDSRRVEKLVDAVDHPNFRLLIDIGNFICVDEDPGVAVGRVLPYAGHIHAKDFHLKPGTAPNPGAGWNLSRGGNYWRGAIIGHGDVPVTQCLKAIRKAGYDDILSIEFEGMEDPLQGIAIGAANLRRYLAQIDAANAR